MFRRVLDIITITVGVIILILWLIELIPVYKTTASIFINPDNYIYDTK